MDLRRLVQNNQFQIYGFLLSLSHIVTHFFWNAYDFEFGLIYKLSNPIFNNWPFIGDSYVHWISANAQAVVYLYLLTSLVSIIAFTIPRIPEKILKLIFTAPFALKLMIYFSSYDFMGNYQYMAHIIFVLYLCADKRFQLLQLALVLFYFGAGLIKLNTEWISGAALLRETFLPQPWLTLACLYVIFLELLAVWFLGSQKKWLVRIVFFQLICFHLFSWHIVGFYYPLMMLLMLSIFLLNPQPFLDLRFLKKKTTLLYVSLFLLAQAYPKLLQKNEALTAEGRMLSLNMLDAKTLCLPSFEIKTERGYLYIDEPLKYATRVRCDPLVWYNYGKTLCNGKDSVRLSLRGRKTTDTSEKLVIDQVNICEPQYEYSIFGNGWIQNSAVPDFFKEEVLKIHHWRQNSSRTGHNHTPLVLNSTFQKIAYPLQINYHTAAKSSPLLLNKNQFAVGSDANVLFFGNKDKISHQTYFSSSSFGIHGSPVVINERYVLIGNYNGVISLIDSVDGRRIWANRIGDAIGSSPVVIGTKVFVTVEILPQQSRLVQLSLRSGEIQNSSDLFEGLAHSSVALTERYAVFGTNSGLLISFDTLENKLRWQLQIDGKIQTTPLIFEDKVYAFSSTGTLVQVELESGNILKSMTLPSGSRASPSFDETNRILILASDQGVIQAFDENLEKQIWQQQISANTPSSGLITGSSKENVYWSICENQSLCAYRTTDGKLRQRLELADSFSSTPDFDGKSFILTLDNQSGYYYFQNSLRIQESR